MSGVYRVPDAAVEDLLSQLRQAATVERESQSVQDIARDAAVRKACLRDARRLERRLVQLLEHHTGKVPERLTAEQELARVRWEIERLELRAETAARQRGFALVEVHLNEPYVQEPPPTVGRRARESAALGYEGLSESAIWLVSLLVGLGPPLAFWCAVLYWPARFAWRRWRACRAAEAGPFGA